MRVVRPFRACLPRALRGMVCAAAALLVACHSSTLTAPGTPVVTFGNLNNSSDFAGYIISVDGFTLVDAGNNTITPLVTAETVDLTKNGSVEELVEAPAVPSDTYVKATITLDYTSPAVFVNLNGQAVRALVVDPATGDAPTIYTIQITFDPDHPLVIPPGVSTRMHIDIDLAASNTIDTATSPPTVSVQPFVTISLSPTDTTPLRARGVFVVTQPADSNFIMNTRPFYDQVSALGALFVNTGGQTYFNVNGVAYTGAAGLAAMNSQQVNIPVVAFGTLGNVSGITPYFNASEVYVGTSQESPIEEYITGVVSARSGATLTVSGATFLTPVGFPYSNNVGLYYGYYPTASVTLADTTTVSQDGVDARDLSTASISVGQQINVSGQANIDTTTGLLTSLDASLGQVRLQSTSVWGTLNSATANSVSLDVLSLGGFAPAAFNFAGTGSSGQDATPDDYVVSTGSLDEGSLAPNTLLQVQGSAAPFGGAPPAFNAATVSQGTATLQQLVVEWTEGGATHPFSGVSSAGLTVDLANANLGSFHYIRSGPAELDLKTLPASPLITTVGADQSALVLAVGSSTAPNGISVYNSAAAFASAVLTDLNGLNKFYRLVAYGQYNSSTNTFVASRINLALYETS